MPLAVNESMSKNNNVNPNFYNDGGRDHTEGPYKGELREESKQEMGQQKHNDKEANFIPGRAPVGEKDK